MPKVPKLGKKTTKVSKVYQMLPKVGKIYQTSPKVTRIYQKLPKITTTKNNPKLPNASTKRWLRSKVTKNWQKLPNVTRIYPKNQKLLKDNKSCQQLPKVGKSYQYCKTKSVKCVFGSSADRID